jgi:hypothetical protein
MRGLSSSSSKQHDLTAPTAVLWAQQSIYRYLVRAQEQRLLQQLAQVRRSAAQALWGYGTVWAGSLGAPRSVVPGSLGWWHVAHSPFLCALTSATHIISVQEKQAMLEQEGS